MMQRNRNHHLRVLCRVLKTSAQDIDRIDDFSSPAFCQAIDALEGQTSPEELDLIGELFEALVLSPYGSAFLKLPPSRVDVIAASRMRHCRLGQLREVHQRFVTLILDQDHVDYLPLLAHVDFHYLSVDQIRRITRSFPTSTPIPQTTYRSVLDSLIQLEEQIRHFQSEFKKDLMKIISSGAIAEVSAPNSFSPEGLNFGLQWFEESYQEMKREIVDTSATVVQKAAGAFDEAARLKAETAQLRAEIGLLKVRPGSEVKSPDREFPAHRKNCADILSVCGGRWDVTSSPSYKLEELRLALSGALPTHIGSNWTGWFSDPAGKSRTVTIRFQDKIYPVVSRYSLSSGFEGSRASPFMRSWELWGSVNGEWILLDRRSATNVLSDGKLHTFEVSDDDGYVPVEAVRLCQVGRNGSGSLQIHLNRLILSGDIVGPRELIGCESSRFAQITWPNDSEECGQDREVIPCSGHPEPRSEHDAESRANISADLAKCGPETALLTSMHQDPSPLESAGLHSMSSNGRPLQGVSDASRTAQDFRAAAESERTGPGDRPPRHDEKPTQIQSDERDGHGIEPAIPAETSPADNPNQSSTVDELLQTRAIKTVSVSDGIPKQSDKGKPGAPHNSGAVKVNERVLFPDDRPPDVSPRPLLIQSMANLEEVGELGAGRFGVVRHIRRRNADGEIEEFAAKYYNPGENRDVLHEFQDRTRPFLELSHPHVMPIVGIVPPTKAVGPIILTPYSPFGSLEDVLNRVRRGDPPWFWNNRTKLCMIMGLLSGLMYLHNHGIVHQELKPRDLIVEADGSLKICGYVTGILAEHKFTRASQVGDPSYMAPELYDESHNGPRVCDPMSDVFSFSMILYEILFHQKVFPSSMAAVVVMRRAMSSRPKDRPMIPDFLHLVLKDMIRRCWVPAARKRPTLDSLWKQMKNIDFKLFPDVTVSIETV
jgi:hypothetical protein